MYILGLFSLYIMLKRLNVNNRKHSFSERNLYAEANDLVTINNISNISNIDYKLNKKNIKRIMKKKLEGGYDERFSKNVSYDKDMFSNNFTFDEEKLNIFNAKAKLFTKLTSSHVSQIDKLKSVQELHYFTNTSIYSTNINAANLYNDWLFDI